MTTTTTATVPPPAATVPAGPRASWAAVLALAGFEARRLLTRLSVLLAFAVYVGWIVWRTRTSFAGFPALQDADRATQAAPLLVGLAVLLSVNQAMLRSRRYDTEGHFAVLVLPPWRRTVAHLLSLVPAALLVAVCVGGQFGWEALKPGALGNGSPGELLVGPLCVLLLGTLGVLLARLFAFAFAAPLLLVVLLFFSLFAAMPQNGDATRWLMPVVDDYSIRTLPSELLGRPAAWHALYLAGLALSVALAAVLVSGEGAGARPGSGSVSGTGRALRGRFVGNRGVHAGFAGAVALTLLGAVMQTGGVPAETEKARTRYSTAPQDLQQCVERDGTTYCAFPEWTPRADDWAEVVDRVKSLAGDAVQDRSLVVRQRVEARYGLTSDAAMDPLSAPNQVSVGTMWGGNRVPEFAVAVAGVLVTGKEAVAGTLCDGRLVTVMWLALAGGSDPLSDLRDIRIDDSTSGSAVVVSETEPLSMTAAHTELVRELLDRPREEIGAKVTAHWAELTTPEVTTDRTAHLLGLDAPEEADECQE
ncbi:ABC transporter permease [Streptomyces sp. NPDC005774]|uniref:ABC transporter permease n=1 Tax=Streptomyces sp. NPDC005774 TaxID=3364728 RepID=UPI0036941C5E